MLSSIEDRDMRRKSGHIISKLLLKLIDILASQCDCREAELGR